MISFDQTLIEDAVAEINDLEDNVDELTDRTGNYSLYKQVSDTVDREVASPILQRARDLGEEYVGSRVSTIYATDGRWEGNRYRAGITSNNEVVLAHEYGSGQYGRGDGPYEIHPTGSNDYLVFDGEDGHPVRVEMVVHPGVRGKRFMQRAVREQRDRVAQELEDDAQQTISEAIADTQR